MSGFAPPFVPADFYAPGLNLPTYRIPPFLDYLEHRIRELRIPRRSTWPLLRALVAMWLQNGARSKTGAMWAKPSQRALGTILRHPWGPIRRPLDRCTVNRLCRLLESRHVLQVKRRARAPSGDEDPQGHGWQLSNLYQPGPWIWQVWRQWCVISATRLRGFRAGGLPGIFRRVLAWASRHLFGVITFSALCVPPYGKAENDGGGEALTGPPPRPPSAPPSRATPEADPMVT